MIFPEPRTSFCPKWIPENVLGRRSHLRAVRPDSDSLTPANLRNLIETVSDRRRDRCENFTPQKLPFETYEYVFVRRIFSETERAETETRKLGVAFLKKKIIHWLHWRTPQLAVTVLCFSFPPAAFSTASDWFFFRFIFSPIASTTPIAAGNSSRNVRLYHFEAGAFIIYNYTMSRWKKIKFLLSIWILSDFFF